MATLQRPLTDLSAYKGAGTLLYGLDPTDPTKVNALMVDTSGEAAIEQSISQQFKARNVGALVALKTVPGELNGLQVLNGSAAPAYVQVFNLAVGAVTLGTTTPDFELLVAAGTQVIFSPPLGIVFSVAISLASTTLEGGSVASATGVQVFAQYT